MLMIKWTVAIKVKDFVKYGQLYSFALTFSKMGSNVVPCLKSMDLFLRKKEGPIHTYKGKSVGNAVAITINQQLTEVYDKDNFASVFYRKHQQIHGTVDMKVLGLRYAPRLKRCYERNRMVQEQNGTAGQLKNVRAGCSFTTLSGYVDIPETSPLFAIRKLYVGQTGLFVSRREIRLRIVMPDDYVEIDVENLREYCENLSKVWYAACYNPQNLR